MSKDKVDVSNNKTFSPDNTILYEKVKHNQGGRSSNALGEVHLDVSFG